MITNNKEFFKKFITYYFLRLLVSVILIASLTYYQATHHLLYFPNNMEKYFFIGTTIFNTLMFPFSYYGLSYLYMKVTKKPYRYIRPWEVQIITRRVPLHSLITIFYIILSFSLLYIVLNFSYILGIPSLIFFILSAIKAKKDPLATIH